MSTQAVTLDRPAGSRPAAADGVPTRVVTGLTPSGRLHIGNYVGAIRPLLALASRPSTSAVVFVADLHAMTNDHDPARLRADTRELAATLLACGLGDDATLFLQSAVPAHTELAYLLECTAAYGEMTRMIQFKEKAGSARGAARLSLLTYPALMAADILLYRADRVPVGDDQRQHLELTRTLARRFNARYGEVFTVPSPAVPGAAARLKDLRLPSAKMGKSSAGSGTVHLLDDPVRIAATVRAAVTDLDPALTYDPELRPGVANLAELLGGADRAHAAGRARRPARRRCPQGRRDGGAGRDAAAGAGAVRGADQGPGRGRPPARLGRGDGGGAGGSHARGGPGGDGAGAYGRRPMSACPVAGSNGTDSWSRTIRHRPPPLNQWPLGPIGHRPLGPGDRRDPPMTEVEQVLGGDAAAAVIRRPDGDDVRARLVQRVEDDERDAPRRQHGAGVVGREHEDHAPRASLDEIGDPRSHPAPGGPSPR